jgi:branched-chain amino acid aminotransferase
MNVMFVINGTLVTAPTNTGTILKGITRDSVLTLAREMGMPLEERFLRVDELQKSLEDGSLQEAFGTGTAATVAHIQRINVNDTDYNLPQKPADAFSNRVLKKLDAIKYGLEEDSRGWIRKY